MVTVVSRSTGAWMNPNRARSPETSQSAVQNARCPSVLDRMSLTRVGSASTSTARVITRSMVPPLTVGCALILDQSKMRMSSPQREVRLEPLQVIAAPRRLRILELVWDRELAAGDIAAQFDISWSAISQHLTVLKAAGFVVERRAGRSRLYRADKAALGPLRSIV